MGHGYFTVIGFGFVVSIQDFKKDFPECVDSRNELDYDQVLELCDKYNISIRYEQEGECENVFICSQKSICMDARGACGSYREINIKELESLEHLQNLCRTIILKHKLNLWPTLTKDKRIFICY